MKKGVFKISPDLHENSCTRVFFLIKLQASDLQLCYKRDSGTGIFLSNLRNFQEHLFTEQFRTTASRIITNISFFLSTLVDS